MASCFHGKRSIYQTYSSKVPIDNPYQPSKGGRPQSIKSNRLPLLHIFPHGSRAHIVASAGEFVGTFLFLFFALSGTQVANTTDKGAVATTSTTTNNVLFIALCFGFSLAVNAWVFFRISGGLFNPAVCTCEFNSRDVRMLIILEGDARNVSGGCCHLFQGITPLHRATAWCDLRSSSSIVFVSGTFDRDDESWFRHLCCSGTFHRDVFDGGTCLHHFHAGCRKAQGYLHRAHRHVSHANPLAWEMTRAKTVFLKWSVTVHCRTDWYVGPASKLLLRG